MTRHSTRAPREIRALHAVRLMVRWRSDDIMLSRLAADARCPIPDARFPMPDVRNLLAGLPISFIIGRLGLHHVC